MMQGLNSFPLMAVPLFTFAGEVMGKGGISARLINAAKVVSGRCTGGFWVLSNIPTPFFAALPRARLAGGGAIHTHFLSTPAPPGGG